MSSPPLDLHWTGEARAVTPRRPMTVVHVLRSLDTGGQELMCARLVERLDPRRFRPLVVSLQGSGWLEERLRQSGVPVRCLEAPEGAQPGLVLEMARVLRAVRADVVHCHNRKALLYGGLASLLAPGCRLVFTKHGASFWTGRATGALGRLLVRRSAAVVAVSRDIEAPLRDGGWGAPERLHTVLNGIDTQEFAPGSDRNAARAGCGLPAGVRVIGTVARLSPEKDQSTLLKAFARVAARRRDAHLLIVGDGGLRGQLEAEAAALRIGGRVRFAGERKDVARMLAAMDVFCLPSRAEGTSLTLLEAMACGLPVVATAVGGNPEVVRDGESGLLVPAASPEHLGEALLTVLADPDGAARMGAAGRQTVLSRYSLGAMVDAYSQIYERVVEPRR